jgi:hypothetical protein
MSHSKTSSEMCSPWRRPTLPGQEAIRQSGDDEDVSLQGVYDPAALYRALIKTSRRTPIRGRVWTWPVQNSCANRAEHRTIYFVLDRSQRLGGMLHGSRPGSSMARVDEGNPTKWFRNCFFLRQRLSAGLWILTDGTNDFTCLLHEGEACTRIMSDESAGGMPRVPGRRCSKPPSTA